MTTLQFILLLLAVAIVTGFVSVYGSNALFEYWGKKSAKQYEQSWAV